MVRWLVWTCGGLVVVGVLIRLSAASAAGTADQASAKAGRPAASSTPASASFVDPAVQFEMGIQQRLLKGGVLSPPGPNASPDELKAYEYVLEAKKNEVSDAQAVHEGAQRLWKERQAKRDQDRKDRKKTADERGRVEREKWEQKKARQEAELPPEVIERRKNTPRPIYPPPPPALIEDPANPVPKPPVKQ